MKQEKIQKLNNHLAKDILENMIIWNYLMLMEINESQIITILKMVIYLWNLLLMTSFSMEIKATRKDVMGHD